MGGGGGRPGGEAICDGCVRLCSPQAAMFCESPVVWSSFMFDCCSVSDLDYGDSVVIVVPVRARMYVTARAGDKSKKGTVGDDRCSPGSTQISRCQ